MISSRPRMTGIGNASATRRFLIVSPMQLKGAP